MGKRNPDGRKSMVKTKRLVRTSMELIRLAYDNKITEMQKFIDDQGDDCRQMQLVNADVLVYALLRKQFKSYAILQTCGFQMPVESEGKTQKFKKLTEDDLKKLKTEIRQY